MQSQLEPLISIFWSQSVFYWRERKRQRDLTQAHFGTILAVALIAVIGVIFLIVQNQTQQDRLL